uniref:Uncharacterized protein n=1 Tax=Trichobilharzia regenti TaxID=157069 RepID=A0AA85J265_TRIRE|nr:unnamed protein product [Trichobilharzia regenti]
MSIFRISCFLLIVIMAICTLITGLALAPFWQNSSTNGEKIQLSFCIISVILLGSAGLLTFVSIICGVSRTRKLIVLSLVLLILAVGFLCSSNVLMLIGGTDFYKCWIFASLWITAACIPFALGSIYTSPIQLERL